ncbi:MAG: methionyl-tRNA formyltransferase [cyanobacterium endosymbiont of Rhopalodia musculus]|uniref:methionyl-tRNA formyltransferase n=1 Tax=cyanobacterium endosymbiont of Epithemia clementina EcSB TaxID=3034674 RepID=UPI0024811E55|nr:methionyl-tRNA formyltransferase [cyanobacterium endosymbiont of Epithemia clementina EcSB]WGT67259.1 methionyl-tRNA formyltransferase [cyanobacterium endosymbiont of Epithemia clementina EcSB]
MQVIFFGTPQFAVPTLQRLLDHSHCEVIGVVTQPDKRRGRGKQLIPSAVKKVALQHNLPVWQPKRVRNAQKTLSELRGAQADAFVVVAYGQILSPEILSIPKLGCINVHGSILPQYRGAAPIQWSVYHGEQQAGITTMLMDEGMDTGDILLKFVKPIGLLDNSHKIAEELAQNGADLLLETLQKLEAGDIVATPQNPAEATYAPLIQKSDYEINWSKPAIAIHNQVRGFYPNCITNFRDRSLKIMATIPLEDIDWESLPSAVQPLRQQLTNLPTLQGKPGEILSNLKNFGPVVQTGEGLLLLQEVQLSGKRRQSGWDFLNGTHVNVGEVFI